MGDHSDEYSRLKQAGKKRAFEMLSRAMADGTLKRIPTTKGNTMSNENEMYQTKRLKQENRSVVAQRLTTDAEPNVFTDARKKQVADRRGLGQRKQRKAK